MPETSAVGAAEQRALAALARLENALRGTAADERAVLERDCELLRVECDALRRQLTGVDERSARLVAIAEQAEGRLDGAITQLDELAAG
jgi:hypothetical protein